MKQEHLSQMKTGEVAKRARKAGVDNPEQMNKNQMMAAISRSGSGRGGGRGQHAPRPPGTSPQQWKNVPGNQS